MLYVLIVLLCGALAVVAVKWLLLRRQVHRIAASIEEIAPGQSNRQLRVDIQDKSALHLANAVNGLYQEVDGLRAAQVRANDELRQSMADISHDLRTPLTSILGYLKLLDSPGNTPGQREEYLGIATRKAEALHRMVDSLFALARLEAGAYPLELVPTDAAEVLTEELAACYEPFAALGQQPALALEGPVMILADRQALQRAFGNLLQNILRHGGSEVEISARREGDTARCVFANRADNLTEESARHIFRRSYTGEASRNSQNTGLGLAITYQLVRQMNGEIAAAFADGRLAITITWPLLPR